MKKTKIVCTIGPSSWDYPTLKKLSEAGMNVARLNFSHGSHAEKGQQIQTIRKISKELGKSIAIMADLQGPKLRLGTIDGIRKITKGESITLSLNPTLDEIPIQFDLSPFVKKGQRIFLNDGLIELKVNSIAGKSIKAIAHNSGAISSHKGINIPDTYMQGSVFTPKDITDAKFALEANVDYLALSFIQKATDLKPVKKLIQEANSKTKIVVKIEKNEAVSDLEEIMKDTDAVMVARGDLAIETKAAEVPIIQQKIIKLGRSYHRPVIVATQMLESMVENPRPTRAEVSDVANAVLDQADCVMLSAESASGKYPVEAVQTMSDIILSVESHPDYKHSISIDWNNISSKELSYSAIVSSAAILAEKIVAKFIVIPTASGRMARHLSAFRPSSRIIAITHSEKVYHQLAMVWGIETIVIKPVKTYDAFLENILESVQKYAKKGDQIVVVTGSTVGISGGTDTIRVVTI